MTNHPHIPATQNTEWGFFSGMNEQAATAWPIAVTAISDATGEALASVRIFLDSRHGRHFADEVLGRQHGGQALADAIRATIRQWMDWKIGRQTSKQYGIPSGMPYLTGSVVHGEISDTLAA